MDFEHRADHRIVETEAVNDDPNHKDTDTAFIEEAIARSERETPPAVTVAEAEVEPADIVLEPAPESAVDVSSSPRPTTAAKVMVAAAWLELTKDEPPKHEPTTEVTTPSEGAAESATEEVVEPSQAQAGGGGSGNDRTPPDIPSSPDEGDDNDEFQPNVETGDVPQAQLEVHETAPRPQSDLPWSDQLWRQDTLADTVRQIGRNVSEEAIVAGSVALREAVGDIIPAGNDVDVAVSPELAHYIGAQAEVKGSGWQERRYPDGKLTYVNGDIELGAGFGTHPQQAHDKLLERSWTNEEGVLLASPPDLTAYMDARNLPKDNVKLDLVRQHLQDPEASPFPREATWRERQRIYEALPPEIRDQPGVGIGIDAAADNVLASHTLYGSPDIGNTGRISGRLERPEYGVRAYYHNGKDLLTVDTSVLVEHTTTVNAADRAAGREETFTPEDIIDLIVAQCGADVVYANGRASNQPPDDPGGYDEMRSADRARGRLMAFNYPEPRADKVHGWIAGTAFTEGTGEQAGKLSDEEGGSAGGRALTAADLQGLSERKGLVAAADLAYEDHTSARWSAERICGKVALEYGVEFATARDAYVFADAHPDARPSDMQGEGKTFKEALLDRLGGNAGFTDVDGYQFAEDWTQEKPRIRRENAELCRQTVAAVQRGEIGMTELYDIFDHYEQIPDSAIWIASGVMGRG